MCQVVKDYFGTKGVRVSQNISLPGRLVVIMPQMDYVGISHKISDEARRVALLKLVKENCPAGVGFIIRTAAQNADDADIVKEMNSLVQKWKSIVQSYKTAQDGDVVYEEGDLIFRTIRDILDSDIDRIIVNNEIVARDLRQSLVEIYGDRDIVELYTGTENLFTYYNLQSQISKLIKRKVILKNGAYIVIDRTEALTAIDVNTGKYVGENDLEKHSSTPTFWRRRKSPNSCAFAISAVSSSSTLSIWSWKKAAKNCLPLLKRNSKKTASAQVNPS